MDKIISKLIEDVKKNLNLENDLQKWVVENIYTTMPFDKKFLIKKLGKHKELCAVNRNQKIIKVYYFKKPNITIFINILKNTIITWRLGEQTSI